MKEIVLGKSKIGKNHPPFIIAEMSGNHNHSLDRALEIVKEAHKCGVNALKIQTYTADTMTLNIKDREFYINDSKSLWKGESLYKLYQKAYTPWEWHKPIFDKCNELGIIPFSTPYDESSVDFLETLNPQCYKIASFENTDINLIKRVARTGKPLIISTGMSSISDIDLAVKTAREAGCSDLILLKCTSAYPALPENANIKTIPHMSKLFNVPVGLSDHTFGIGVAIASIALGVRVIEKHFTLCRNDGGVDSTFSLEPNEMKLLVDEANKAYKAVGEVVYGCTSNEINSKKLKRSLYITKDIKRGEILSKENLRAIRPGLGLESKYYDIFLGRKVNQDIKKGTPLSWDLI
ncbi:pseudaminic acid synthase [Clostridiaceae bacterium M8S5]|nr:pseudaminic acid synthase [Clostridiaceae bacterium M8S5]